jgi:hypothetical protein
LSIASSPSRRFRPPTAPAPMIGLPRIYQIPSG